MCQAREGVHPAVDAHAGVDAFGVFYCSCDFWSNPVCLTGPHRGRCQLSWQRLFCSDFVIVQSRILIESQIYICFSSMSPVKSTGDDGFVCFIDM